MPSTTAWLDSTVMVYATWALDGMAIAARRKVRKNLMVVE
jgi:hypothetical protein